MKFEYATGRRYDAPQVLAIDTVGGPAFDETGEAVTTVFFSDASRGIAGTVRLLLWEGCNDSARDMGPAVLAEYDAGRYVLC